MGDIGATGNPTGQEAARVSGKPPGQDTPPMGYPAVPAPQQGYTSSPPPPPPYSPQSPIYAQAPSRDHEQQRRRGVPIVGPVLLIAAGTLFLLNNLEIVPWSVWGSVWRLWPLVLIAIGLDMLFGHRSHVLSGLIVLGVLAAGAAWIFAGGGWGGWGNLVRSEIRVPLGDARSASVDIDVDSGELRLGSLPAGNNLLAGGTLEYREHGEAPRQDVTTRDGRIELELQQRGGGFPFFFTGDTRSDVTLTRAVTMSLSVNIDSGNAELDLRDLRVTSLDLKVDSGNLTATLSAGAGATTGQADIDSGNLTLHIPEGVSAEIEASVDSGNVDADAAFRREGNRYVLGETREARNRVTLRVHVDSGNLTLRTAGRVP